MRVRSIAIAAAMLGPAMLGPAILGPATLGMPAARAATETRDQAHEAYLAAYNQLGILEYCEAQGYVGADVVARQTRMMSLMPTPEDSAGAADAQRAGREGTIAAGDRTMSLADAAAGEGTAEIVCAEIGDAVTNAAPEAAD